MNAIAASIRELEQQLESLQVAIKTLRQLDHSGGAGGAAAVVSAKRNISPEGRRRIVEAQKRRWAKTRAQKNGAKSGQKANSQ